VSIRATRLSHALARFGIGPADEVAVLCCDRHAQDRSVALRALAARGATALELEDWTDVGLASIAERRPALQLACEEGVAAWRRVDGRGVMIGEGEGILWWKALECRYAEVA
jgi:hypothetical protein